MGTIIKFSGDYQFPPVCVVCLRPAEHHHTIEKSLGYGQRASLLTIDVPMCEEHAGLAANRSSGERLSNRLALVSGTLIALLTAAALINYWQSSAQVSPLSNGLLAAFIGFSLGLTLWAVVYFYISPWFAPPAVKQIRAAVKIRQANGALLVLEFHNPQAAAAFSAANSNHTQ
jgi:hypothetical protein